MCEETAHFLPDRSRSSLSVAMLDGAGAAQVFNQAILVKFKIVGAGILAQREKQIPFGLPEVVAETPEIFAGARGVACFSH